jgi:hypothetical protein
MQKALTTLALILASFAAASAVYYYGKYLPRLHDAELADQRRKTDLENTQRCNKDAWKFYSDYRSNYRKGEISLGLALTPDWNWSDPEMHFNKKLNTCLLEITIRKDRGGGYPKDAGGGVRIFESVTDIYSNREILSTAFIMERGEETPIAGIGSRKYSVEKDKLFSE